jgi:CSLREA domain-containing protein
MRTQTSGEGSAWTQKSKMLAAGLLLAAMLIAGTMAAGSARAATTFTVNSTADTPDASLAGAACHTDVFTNGDQCTLRAAIEQANATAGADAINFAVPGTGVKTIAVGATGNGGLPTIVDQVSINGYSQSGASPNTLARGTNAKLMIELNGGAAGAADGLEVGAGGSGSVIKGLVVNRFANQGIEVLFDGPTNVRIEGNFVGTDASGTAALPNRGDGIEMDASNSVVGGSTPAKRNLISGNAVDGLSISGDAKEVRVEGNLVGTKADGVGALGNLFNGIDVAGGTTGARIISNSIFSNGQLGIDLGVDGRTLNDLGDTDTGANGLQNFPVISTAKTVSDKTTVKGKLNSRPNAAYTVQFFSNPSGTDEGRRFIGQKSVTTDGSGNASFTFTPSSKVAAGQNITATATDSSGNTSEFSAPRTVASS